jgi:hypothetical protein
MTTDDTRFQIDRWLDGDLPEADEAALQVVLENDRESVAFLAHRAVLHGLLRDAAGRAVVVGGCVEPRRRWSLGRHVVWVAAAALVCTIVVGLASLPQATASPVAVVQKALDACSTLLDRRYAVRIEPSRSALRTGAGRSLVPWESTLWARDARFVQSMEVADRHLVWGRDARGAVWFSVSRRAVAVFEADEIPDTLRELCDLRTLDLETLLASLLAEFDLERTGLTASTDMIVARPRAGTGPSRFGSVELEIDRESMLVRSVVLERRHRDRQVAIVRFTLEETASGKEAEYEWHSHVDPDAEVCDRRSALGARRELLAEFLRLLRRVAAES